MASKKIQYLSMVVVATFIAALSTTIPTATFGQTEATLPRKIVGTWTNTETLLTPQGEVSEINIHTLTFFANGHFKHSNLYKSSLLTKCPQTISASEVGKAFKEDSSSLGFVIKSGNATRQGKCVPTVTKPTAPSDGFIGWRYNKDIKKGEQLCIKSSGLFDGKGDSIVGCFSRPK